MAKKPHYELKYIYGLPAGSVQKQNLALPSTYALIWCMQKTEVARIFNRDDLHEFLFRLALVFHPDEVLTPKKIEDSLLSFSFNKEVHQLNTEDIMFHFGLEAYDHYINHTDRERYIWRAKGGIEFALKVGYNSYFPELDLQEYKRPGGKIKYPPLVSNRILKKAGEFASRLMEIIPAEVFKLKNKAFKAKERELATRQQRINKLKRFDIYKIPSGILRKCLLEAYAEEHVNQLMASPEELRKEAGKMIYVGWAYANCFMKEDGTFSDEKKNFILDFMDFEVEGGGDYRETGMRNLTYNCEFNRIDVIAPCLKGIDVF